jgi:prevent-host-death family protein
MGKHSVAEAQTSLSSLIDRALDGEDVVITRHGQPVVELRPVRQRPGPISRESIEWLRANRVKPLKIGDAAELVSRMRDEDDERLS